MSKHLWWVRFKSRPHIMLSYSLSFSQQAMLPLTAALGSWQRGRPLFFLRIYCCFSLLVSCFWIVFRVVIWSREKSLIKKQVWIIDFWIRLIRFLTSVHRLKYIVCLSVNNKLHFGMLVQQNYNLHYIATIYRISWKRSIFFCHSFQKVKPIYYIE